MNYKLIEDKNGTIISKGKRYRMSKLEYTKDDLIDIQSDYDLLYKKLDHYNKIINTQALEIAKLNKQLENENKVVEEYLKLENKIDRVTEYINIQKLDYRNDDRIIFIFKKLNEMLGDKENE